MYYDVKSGLKDTSRWFSPRFIVILAGILVLVAAYVVFNYFAPQILAKSADAMQAIETAATTTEPRGDYLRIPVAGVEVFVSDKVTSTGVLRKPSSASQIVLMAKRLSVGLTPAETIKQSPLYSLAKVKVGDTIYLDKAGQRIVFKVEAVSEQKSADTARGDLVVYSYESHNDTAAVLVTAKRLGVIEWIDGQAKLKVD
jgi:sortase (surface protein transpeptidase)